MQTCPTPDSRSHLRAQEREHACDGGIRHLCGRTPVCERLDKAHLFGRNGSPICDVQRDAEAIVLCGDLIDRGHCGEPVDVRVPAIGLEDLPLVVLAEEGLSLLPGYFLDCVDNQNLVLAFRWLVGPQDNDGCWHWGVVEEALAEPKNALDEVGLHQSFTQGCLFTPEEHPVGEEDRSAARIG